MSLKNYKVSILVEYIGELQGIGQIAGGSYIEEG